MHRRRVFLVIPILAAVMVLNAPRPLHSQSEANTGSIRGTVADPSGAVVPNATVTGKQVETGYTRQSTTGPDGYYTLMLLPVGRYELRFEAPGFATLVQSGLAVDVGREVTLNVELKVGLVTSGFTSDQPVAPRSPID